LDLAAAVNSLLDNSELRKKMGKAGRQRAVAHYSWKAVAKQVKDLYISVIEARKKS